MLGRAWSLKFRKLERRPRLVLLLECRDVVRFLLRHRLVREGILDTSWEHRLELSMYAV